MSTRPDVMALRAMLRDPAMQESARVSGVYPSSYEGNDDPAPMIAQRRRARRAMGSDPVGVASLMVDDEGVLYWTLDVAARTRSGSRRLRRGVPEGHDGEVEDAPDDLGNLSARGARLDPLRRELRHDGVPVLLREGGDRHVLDERIDVPAQACSLEVKRPLRAHVVRVPLSKVS